MWTTTPWTLVSNAAVAVDPELTYVRARLDGDGADRSPRRWSSACSARAARGARPLPGLARSRASAYEPPFDFIPGSAYGERGHTVLLGDFVTAERRHRPRPHGDRVRRGRLPPRRAVRADRGQPGPARRHLRRADRPVRRPLGQGRRRRPDRGPARAAAGCCAPRRYEHSYPHCWRCGTPLLYYAKPSWYIATSQIKDRLLAANETVNWHPEHVKHGRFGNWLEDNVDWALSRERYWGTPLPVWRCADGHVARDRLARRAARALRRDARGSPPPVRRRGRRSRARSAASRCDACPR